MGPDVLGRVGGIESPFLGREAALLQLTLARQDQHLVTVRAPAGGGKTRLVHEWSKSLPDRILWSKAERESAPSPFQMFSGPVATLEAELASRPDLVGVLTHELGVELPLMRSLGVGRGTGLQRGIVVMLALLLTVVGRDRPTILVLDDCQWSDPLTLSFLQYWGEHGQSMLVIAIFREDEVDEHHALRRLKGYPVQLAPLADEAARQLLLSRGQLEASALPAVLAEARGNPFSLLSLSHGGPAALRDEMARLAALPKELRQALELASVLGREFSLSSLCQCLERPVDLDPAQQHGFIQAVAEGIYGFPHDRVRDLVFGAISIEDKREHHLRVARYLLALNPSCPFAPAFHFSSAGRPEEGFAVSCRAAEMAQAEHDSSAAVFYFRAALAGSRGEPSETRERLWTQLGDCHRMTGTYPEALVCFQKALDLCRELPRRARLLERIGDVYFKRGELAAARDAIERGLAVLGESWPRTVSWTFLRGALAQALRIALPRRKAKPEARPQDLLKVDLYNRLAYVLWFLEGPLPSIAAHLRELNLAEKSPPSRSLARARASHAIAMSALPNWSRSLSFGQSGWQTARDLGDHWAEGQAGHFYGAALYGASRLVEAAERLESAVDILRRTGDRWEENGARYHLALVYYRRGLWAEATEMAAATHRIGVELGDRLAAGDNLFTWARASHGLMPGEPLRREREHDNPDIQRASELLGAEGLLAIRAGRYGEACDLFERGISLYKARRAQTMYYACLPCWSVTALRLRAQSEGSKRGELLAQARRKLRSALRLAQRYRNELPHALREQAILAHLSGQPESARRSLDRSLGVASELGLQGEVETGEALRKLWLGQMSESWQWLLEPRSGPSLPG